MSLPGEPKSYAINAQPGEPLKATLANYDPVDFSKNVDSNKLDLRIIESSGESNYPLTNNGHSSSNHNSDKSYLEPHSHTIKTAFLPFDEKCNTKNYVFPNQVKTPYPNTYWPLIFELCFKG
ncbi:MAG: hypothetical protein AAGA77_24860 [Bacteroidota bacterium]